MKKLLTIMACLPMLVGNTIGFSQHTYGNWQSIHCYPGLDYSVRRNEYNEYSKSYNWTVKFRNRYNTSISFSYVLKESNIVSAKTTDRSTIRAGGETGTWFLVNDANQVNVFVDSFRFGEDVGPYASCGSNHNDTQSFAHNQGPSAGAHSGESNSRPANVGSTQNSNPGMTMHNIDNTDELTTQLEELAQKVGVEAAKGNTAGIKSAYQSMILILKQMIKGYEQDVQSRDALIGAKNQLEQIEELLKSLN